MKRTFCAGDGRVARFVWVTVFPRGLEHLSLDTLEVLVRQPAVAAGVKALAGDLAFYEPDGPFPEGWKVHWSQEEWRDFVPAVPSIGGPGAYVKAYFHNPRQTPVACSLW